MPLVIYGTNNKPRVVERAGENMSDPTKFNTCTHRSETEVTEPKRNCCRVIAEYNGFKCHKRGIIPLNATTCFSCEEYQAKETPQS